MKSNYKQLGQYIRQVDVRNVEGKEENLLGVSVQKQFIPSIANTVGTDFKKYKIVKKGQFTYIPDTSRRGDKIGIALLQDYEEGLVSNVYTVFEVIDKNQLMPEYLMLWFSRPEFDRYSRYMSHGSVREIFGWEEMCKVKLPVPDIEKQRSIVKAYKTIADRIALKKKINEKLEATAQAIYKSWFIDFEPFEGTCPQNWINGCIGDIAEFYDSMRKPLSALERVDMEHTYPYYGAVSLVDYVDDFIFDGEYLLVSEDGYVIDENGHPLLQHITGKFWANNHAHIIKGKAGFNEDSLYLFLANSNMASIVTGAVQPKINQANLKNFPITIPTGDIIKEFNALIQPFFDRKLSNGVEVAKLENFKELLLSCLVN